MEDISTPKKLKFTYSMYSIILDADVTLLNIKLQDGFSFMRKSLRYLNKDLRPRSKNDGFELRYDYETARIDNDTLDVICAVKELSLEIDISKAKDFFNEESNSDLVSLDNQIRVIRLLQENSLGFIKVWSNMLSEKYFIENAETYVHYYEPCPISEFMGTKVKSKRNNDVSSSATISEQLPLLSLPFLDQYLNDCHRYYDLSYHVDNHISITLLMIALEMLYLEKSDCKKKPLAQRCAVYLYDVEDDVMCCYDKLLTAYEKRSDFVHEGIYKRIDSDDIIFLRQCVRLSLLKMHSDGKDRKERIWELREVVKHSNYWPTPTNKNERRLPITP